MSDHDTHRGELRPTGAVAAECGALFPPLALPYGRVALPGPPTDPAQICPQCRRGKE